MSAKPWPVRRMLFAILLPAAVLPCLFAQAPAGKKIAILVGVKSYNHAGLPDLDYTEADVTDLARLLEPAGYRVTLLTTGATDARRKPTLANIRRELDTALKDVTKHDTVLVALAGHGMQPDNSKESYFCPLDAKPKDPKTLLNLTALVEQLNDSGVGVKLLLVDACRTDPEPGRGRGVDGSRVEALPCGVAALFSCSAGQRAFETRKAGGGHGIFFHFVLEGLRGQAGKNDRGEVTWSKLADYVQENVPAKVPEWIGGDARQVPHELKNLAGPSPVLVAVRDLGGTRPALLDCTGPGVSAAAVKEAQAVWARYLGRQVEEEDEIAPGVKMAFVLVPPGRFRMGSPEGEEGRYKDETLHEVTITQPFYLGKYDVTQAQYEAVTGKNPSYFKGAELPVETVNWEEADAFVRELSKKPSLKHLYRLPTEAEWEYACRGGRSSSYPFGIGDGRSLSSTQANFDGNYPYGGAAKGPYLEKTTPVGKYAANALGLYDMHGNVYQWCADWYGDYPVGKVTDPTGPSSGSYRVIRGGSWHYDAWLCRAASRGRRTPDFRDGDLGFRLARVPSGVGK